MLVLSRKVGEQVRIADALELTVLQIRGGRVQLVQLGFSGPPEVVIYREEVYRARKYLDSESGAVEQRGAKHSKDAGAQCQGQY